MRSIVFLFAMVLLSCSAPAQKHKKSKKVTDFSITQSKELKGKGTQLVLKQVISDARCPEGLNCVWAGEAQVLVSIYQNKKWMDEEVLTFTPKTADENKVWLSKTLSIPLSKIKSIRLLPYPKDSLKIDPKAYFIKVEMAK